MALQLDALRAAGCDRIFEDRALGAKTDRPGLAQAIAFSGKAMFSLPGNSIWKLDRLARSLAHLIETVTQLEKSGAGLRSLTEAIDTTTPGGRLIFHVFGALAQFERDLIRERTRAGLTAAAARGRRGGREPVVTADRLERAKALIAKSLTVREAASRLKIGKTALYDALISKTAGSRESQT
jgi:DNA invertase Pin-like site-specific DNA recombinase